MSNTNIDLAKIEFIANSKELRGDDGANILECYRVLPESPGWSLLKHQIDKNICFGIRAMKYGISAYTSIVQRHVNRETQETAHFQKVSGSNHKHLMTLEDWDLVQDAYLFAAKYEQVDKIFTIGRIGWKKLADRYGYKMLSTHKSLTGRKCAMWELTL